MSVFFEKQIERGIIATMQVTTYAQRVDLWARQAYTFDLVADADLSGDNYHLSSSHPNQHPGANLVCEVTR
jgi:hypothetical protein